MNDLELQLVEIEKPSQEQDDDEEYVRQSLKDIAKLFEKYKSGKSGLGKQKPV